MPVSPRACNFIKKETLPQVFSCEFCKISKDTFFTEHLWMSASEETMMESWSQYFAIVCERSGRNNEAETA